MYYTANHPGYPEDTRKRISGYIRRIHPQDNPRTNYRTILGYVLLRMCYTNILWTFISYGAQDNPVIEYPEDVTEGDIQVMIHVQMASGRLKRIVYSASAFLIYSMHRRCIPVYMICMTRHLQPRVLKTV